MLGYHYFWKHPAGFERSRHFWVNPFRLSTLSTWIPRCSEARVPDHIAGVDTVQMLDLMVKKHGFWGATQTFRRKSYLNIRCLEISEATIVGSPWAMIDFPKHPSHGYLSFLYRGSFDMEVVDEALWGSGALEVWSIYFWMNWKLVLQPATLNEALNFRGQTNPPKKKL